MKCRRNGATGQNRLDEMGLLRKVVDEIGVTEMLSLKHLSNLLINNNTVSSHLGYLTLICQIFANYL